MSWNHFDGTAGGDGTIISAKQDQDTRYHIVTRTDAVNIPGMEILLKSGDEAFRKIGDATQVSGSDTWDFFWTLTNVPDGDYTLRAQIAGTSRGEEIPITVNNRGPDPVTEDASPRGAVTFALPGVQTLVLTLSDDDGGSAAPQPRRNYRLVGAAFASEILIDDDARLTGLCVDE